MTIEELAHATRRRVWTVQGGIPTYYDRQVLLSSANPTSGWRRLVERHIAAAQQGRFVSRQQRASVSPDGLNERRRSEIPMSAMIMSQGTARPIQWRGRDLFKTVYDFALLPMLLAELRPRSIVEIGSGTGASAIWMADLAAIHGLECQITSVDISAVSEDYPGVDFVTGSARDLDELIPDHAIAAGPRLVLEDAHAAVRDVLEWGHRNIAVGDYIVIEDSSSKDAIIHSFVNSHPQCYDVDTQYTDFFGRNATSCVDSILRRMA
jgi:cephalosporin hydroxylase